MKAHPAHWVIAPLFALSVLGLGAVAATAAPTPVPPPPSSMSQIAVQPARDKSEPKLDSQLAAVAAVNAKLGATAAGIDARARALKTVDDKVQVIVESARTTDRSAARAAVTAQGGLVEAEYAGLVQAIVPISSLSALAAHSEVRRVRPPAAHQEAAIGDEGVATSNANAWQAETTGGTGVKVGIIDLGFNGYTTLQGTGDLPASLTTADFCGGQLTSGTQHGAAVASIVYKMAPAAQLHLICVNTEVTLGQAENYAKAQGIQIVNHSVGWFNTSRGDGSGVAGTPDAIVADAHANGILWVNSAGNAAQAHWSGTFVDGGGGYNLFAPNNIGNFIFIPSGFRACGFLKWDSWPITNQDYDLFLYRFSPQTLVALSVNDQFGSAQAPTEGLCYTNSGAGDTFFFAIGNFNTTTTPRLDLFTNGPPLQTQVAAGSVIEPASSPNTMAVGGICWQSNALETYSSQGPTIDGRIKPDIAGPDSTSSAIYGGFSTCGNSGFTGTSAASPHVAGAAALVKAANPSFGGVQLQNFLTGRAVDLSPPGVDTLTGAGRLWLSTPPFPNFGATPAIGTTLTLTAPAGTPTTVNVNVINNGDPFSQLRVSLNSLTPGYSLTGVPLAFMAGSGGGFTVGCTPPVAAGTLTLNTNDPAHPTVSYPLSCIVPQPSFGGYPVAGSKVTLGGTAGSPTTRTISVTNTGDPTSTLTVSQVSASAGYSVSGLPLSLGAGASGTITIGCTPVTADGSLNLSSNDPSHTSISYSLGCTVLPKLQFYPLPSPVRLLDTRSGSGVVGCDTGAGALPVLGTRTEPAAGGSISTCTGIPAGARAVFGNVTAVAPPIGGYVTLFPSDVGSPPTVANVNYAANSVVNNAFTVGLGPDGAFKIFTGSQTHLVVDISGYFAPPDTGGLYFHPLPSPVRLLDTRSGSGVVGCDVGAGPLPFLGTRTEPAAGGSISSCTGVPAGAKAVFGNVTAVAPPNGGYVTLFPSNVGSPPTVANVNYPAGGVVNNAFTVGLGSDGAFKIFTGSQTHLVIDISGYYDTNATGGQLFMPLPSPVRLLDTRIGPSVVGCDTGAGALPFLGTRTEPAAGGTIGGCTGIPAGANAVFGNVTAVAPPSGGYVTLFPSSVGSPPTVANENYPAGGVVNTAFAVGLGPDGAFKIFTGSQTHLVIDVTGAYVLGP